MKIPKAFNRGKWDCEFCSRGNTKCKIITCDMGCFHYVCECCLKGNLEIIDMLKKGAEG